MKMKTVIRDSVKLARETLTGEPAKTSATDLLETQHGEVKALFAKIMKSDDGRAKRTMLQELSKNLAAHMVIEQEIFYPACRRETDQKDMVIESFEEHGVAQFEMERLLATATTDESFDARVKVLKELIEHHVEEEEEEFFPKAKRQLGKARLYELGSEMKARFDAAVEMGVDSALRAAKATSPSGRAKASRTSGAAGKGGKALAAKRAGARA